MSASLDGERSLGHVFSRRPRVWREVGRICICWLAWMRCCSSGGGPVLRGRASGGDSVNPSLQEVDAVQRSATENDLISTSPSSDESEVNSIRYRYTSQATEDVADIYRYMAATNYNSELFRRLQFQGQSVGRISYLEPSTLAEAASIPIKSLLGVNDEAVDLSYIEFGAKEQLLVTQKRGAIYLFQANEKHNDVLRDANNGLPLPPQRTFGSHSCLKVQSFCSASAALPMSTGFFVVDRHRIVRYEYVWLPDTDAEPTLVEEDEGTRIATFGDMNIAQNNSKGLRFPNSMAEYRPLNYTHIGEEQRITRLLLHAGDSFLFVVDTGNHRVIIMNITEKQQLEYYGQHGISGVAGSNRSCLNKPWSVAAFFPAWESRFEPVFANVFVADRKNHRLVKLNFGFPEDPYWYNFTWDDENGTHWRMEERYHRSFKQGIRLAHSGQYGTGSPEVPRRGLTEPVSVNVYRHYLFVTEAKGNSIIVLTVDYLNTRRLTYVSELFPIEGAKIVGNVATTPWGFIWYLYVKNTMEYTLGSAKLPKQLRSSEKPTIQQDVLRNCLNDTYFNISVPYNETAFQDEITFLLNASGYNYLFPDEDDYINLTLFNRSHMVSEENMNFSAGDHYGFNFSMLNQTVFKGAIEYCPTPPPPEAPPMLFGDELGWVSDDGSRQREVGARQDAAPRLCAASPWLLLFLTATWLQ